MKGKMFGRRDPENIVRAEVDHNEIAKMFRQLSGGGSGSCIDTLKRNGATPINKDAVAETAGGATGHLKYLLK